jgi:hypothetical protein
MLISVTIIQWVLIGVLSVLGWPIVGALLWLIRKTIVMAEAQWPKNSHSRMITGIGTPSSQSKTPRPILSSSISRLQGQYAQGRLVPQLLGISATDRPILNSE